MGVSDAHCLLQEMSRGTELSVTASYCESCWRSVAALPLGLLFERLSVPTYRTDQLKKQTAEKVQRTPENCYAYEIEPRRR